MLATQHVKPGSHQDKWKKLAALRRQMVQWGNLSKNKVEENPGQNWEGKWRGVLL